MDLDPQDRSILKGDMRLLPFKENTFDTVISDVPSKPVSDLFNITKYPPNSFTALYPWPPLGGIITFRLQRYWRYYSSNPEYKLAQRIIECRLEE